MTDASRKYAVHSASDGKYYLLYERKAVEGHEAVAAITYPSPQNPQPFDSAAAAIEFARDHLGATDDDLALARASGQALTHIEACLVSTEGHPLAEITRHTSNAFATVKSSVALARIDIRRRIPRWVEGWADRVSGQLLQIDENDLWIAAQALERNYVVVTSDRDFTQVIGPAVPDLRVLLV